MNAKYLFPAAILAIMTSCGDSPRITNTPPQPSPLPTPEVTDYYVSPTCSDCKMNVTSDQGKGMDNILGHGYDVTGSYLASSSLRPSVIDLAKQSDLNLLTIFSAPAASFGEQISGATPEEFLDALMANSGIDPEFVGTTPCFNETLNALSSNASYILVNNWIRHTIAKIHNTSVYIPRTLSDQFIADTCTLKPSALVAKYGTHFVANASLGISIRTLYSAYVDAPDNRKLSLASSGLKLAESAIVGQLGPDLALSLAGVNNYGATLTKTFCGGDSTLIEYDAETNLLGDLSVWQDSADPDNLALIELSAGDLQPLSYAISDPGLRAQVETAIRDYIRASRIKAEATIPLLQNSNGKTYRYVTSYDESLQLENSYGLKAYGLLGSLSVNRISGSLPLYSHVEADGSQILSLIQPTDEWVRLGYVMAQRGENTVSLYEISDGSRYAYTIEAANSYGRYNEWHPTGAVFYLLRP